MRQWPTMSSAASHTTRPLRCVAVALQLDADRAVSAEALVGSVAGLLEREVPADPEVDTLVVLPEHTGLLAMLVGERGAAARARWREGGSTAEILFALAGSYGEVLGELAQRYPEVRSAGQLIHLACTDTLVRTLVEGFGELAAQRGMWLSVSAALPRWRMVAVNGATTDAARSGHSSPGVGGPSPGGPGAGGPAAGEWVAGGPAAGEWVAGGPAAGEQVAGGPPADQHLAGSLAGPEGAGRPHVAVPAGPGVRNRQLLFAPTGELVVVHDKISLVPMEANAEEGLGLEPAALAELCVADVSIGRVATVISKDAWMPDVNERLDQLGAQILLQPEAFDQWGAADRDAATGRVDLWPPDKLQRGGWWMVQRHPSFRVNITPVLLGTLGELSFDGQPLVAVPSPDGEPGLSLLGQPPDTGWAAVGRWWRERDGDGWPAGPVGSVQPGAAGSALFGPSGESGLSGRVGPSARSGREQQARVRAGASQRVEQPLPTRHADGVAVARVSIPTHPGGVDADRHANGGEHVPRHPGANASIEVAPEPGTVQLVPDLVRARTPASDTAAVPRSSTSAAVPGSSASAAVPDPLVWPGAGRVAGREPEPAGALQPVWLAWVACDSRGRQQLRLAIGDGRSWEPSQPLSPSPDAGGDPVALRRWRPRLAVDDSGPLCCHLGFPVGSWDVLAVRPGADLTLPVRVDDADTDQGVLRERLHDAPAIVADGDGLIAVWSDLRWPWVLPQVRFARSADGGATWTPSRRVDGQPLAGEEDHLAGRSVREARGQATPSIALCDGEVVVAWQERDTAGVPTIWLAWPERDRALPSVRRLPGTGPGPGAGTGTGTGTGTGAVAGAIGDARPDGVVGEVGDAVAGRVPDGVVGEVQGSGSGSRVALPARPVLAAAGTTLWAVWEVWHPQGGAALWATVSRDAGHRWSAPLLMDPSRPVGAHQQRACVVALQPDRAVVVFDDDRAGGAAVVIVTLEVAASGHLTSSASLRIDDAPSGAHARAPVAVRMPDDVLVVWQDTRSGTEHLRSATVRVEQ